MRARSASNVTPAAWATLRNLGIRARQEFVQRRVEQADRHRQTRHEAEQRGEIGPLRRQQLGERGAAAIRVRRHDHFAHGDDTLVVEEHVLGAAQADPLRPEAERRLGIAQVSRRWCGL